MNETHRFRPNRPNPLRYQGGIKHYHVSPPRQNISWEQWVGGRTRRSRVWLWIMTASIVIAITAVTAALWH